MPIDHGMRTEGTDLPFAGVRLRNLVQTCEACPSQWDAEGPDGERIYIRLRHGYFRVDVNAQTVFEDYPPGYDGVMSTQEMLSRTGFSVV